VGRGAAVAASWPSSVAFSAASFSALSLALNSTTPHLSSSRTALQPVKPSFSSTTKAFFSVPRANIGPTFFFMYFRYSRHPTSERKASRLSLVMTLRCREYGTATLEAGFSRWRAGGATP